MLIEAIKEALLFVLLLLSPAIVYATVRLAIGAWQDAISRRTKYVAEK